mgnify:CR=1 FL=1
MSQSCLYKYDWTQEDTTMIKYNDGGGGTDDDNDDDMMMTSGLSAS